MEAQPAHYGVEIHPFDSIISLLHVQL